MVGIGRIYSCFLLDFTFAPSITGVPGRPWQSGKDRRPRRLYPGKTGILWVDGWALLF